MNRLRRRERSQPEKALAFGLERYGRVEVLHGLAMHGIAQKGSKVTQRSGGTVFTRWAHGEGAGGAAMGLGMLVEQAAEAFAIWHGKRPETAPVYAELVDQSH